METNRIQGLFITEDQAYDLACRSEFLKAKPYNLAIMQMQQHWNSVRTEELYEPVVEFNVPNIRTGRNKKFWMHSGFIGAKGYMALLVESVISGHAFNPEHGFEYDVRTALINLEVA